MPRIIVPAVSPDSSLREVRNIAQRMVGNEIPPPKRVKFFRAPTTKLNLYEFYEFLRSPQNQIDVLEAPDENLTLAELKKRPKLLAKAQADERSEGKPVIVIGLNDTLIIISEDSIIIDDPEDGFTIIVF